MSLLIDIREVKVQIHCSKGILILSLKRERALPIITCLIQAKPLGELKDKIQHKFMELALYHM